MAEKKPKKEFSATRKLFNSIMGVDDKQSVDWEGGYKKEARDHGLTKAKHKMEKKEGNKKKKKAAITRLKKNVEMMSKEKPKKKKNVLIDSGSTKIKGKLPKKKKIDYSESNMSKKQIGKHNFDALNSLYDALDGKRPTELDIASAKKVAEDKVAKGVAESSSEGFDFEPRDKGYQIEGLNLTADSGDPDYEAMRLKQRVAQEYLESGDSESLVNQAAIEAGVDMTDDRLNEAERMLAHGDLQEKAEEIKGSKPNKDNWYESEKFLVALAGLAAPLVGYALGGYEGALHGAKATVDGVGSYGKMQLDEEAAQLKARSTKAGKAPTIMVEDPANPGAKIAVIAEYDDTKTLVPMLDAKGDYIESTELAEATLRGGQKLEQLEVQADSRENIEAIKGKMRLEAEELKGDMRMDIQRMIQSATTSRKLSDIQSQLDRLTRKQSFQGKENALDRKMKLGIADKKIDQDKATGKNLPIATKAELRKLGSTAGTIYRGIKSLTHKRTLMIKLLKQGRTDEAIVLGGSMYKDLNSIHAPDAIQPEEANRIAPFLEFRKLNFTGAGEFIGRDLQSFVRQVGTMIEASERTHDKLTERARILQTGKIPKTFKQQRADKKKASLSRGQTKKKIPTNSKGQFSSKGIVYQVIKIENGITYFERVK